MTVSKETAFELGITANVAMVCGQAAAHAGVALSTYCIAHIAEIPKDAQKIITHVLDHLAEIQRVATVMDEYTDAKIEEFGDADPAGMVEISKEIGTSDILKKLQEAVGMTEEQVAEQLSRKEADIAEYAASKGN